MTDWAWWFALVGGFALGFVVAAITTAKMRGVSRMLYLPLREIERMRGSGAVTRERQGHPD